MTKRQTRFALSFAIVLGLMGCNAEEVELTIQAEDIRAVMAGAERTVEFEAEFSASGAGTRDEIQALEEIVARYLPVAVFEPGSGEVTVEGEIILTSNENSAAAYHVLVQPSREIEGYHLVQLRVGDDFYTMDSEIRGVNYMFNLDRYHPTSFRLEGDGLQVLAPAVFVKGDPHLIWTETLSGRMKLVFRGGVFSGSGAGFFVR